MRFQSPLTNLCDVLIQVVGSAHQYESTLKNNEAATRAVLIDPVLRALGWDTANANMVEVEKTQANVRADYALYDSNSISRIIVEAKPLGKNFHSRVSKDFVKYAYTFEVSDLFLTDGIRWHHFDHFNPNDFQASQAIDISKDDVVSCAAYLVRHMDAARFWPVEQNIDALSQKVEELDSKLSTMQKDLDKVLRKKDASSENIPNSSAKYLNIRPAVLSQENSGFIPLVKLENVVGKKPSYLRLPDESIVRISAWKDVLRECCKFALENAPSIDIPFPDRVGKKISLFDIVRPANQSISFLPESYKGKNIYIYLNYDSHNCVANSLYVLEQVPSEFKACEVAVVIKQTQNRR